MGEENEKYAEYITKEEDRRLISGELFQQIEK